MKQSVEMVQLQTQLKAVEKFEKLFESKDSIEFQRNYVGQDTTDSFAHAQDDLINKAFPTMQFSKGSLRHRTVLNNIRMLSPEENKNTIKDFVQRNINNARQYFQSLETSSKANSINYVMHSFTSNEAEQGKILTSMRQLIAAQKNAVTSAIETKKLNSVQKVQLAFRKKLAVKKLNALKAEKTTASRYKVLRSVGIGAMFATGAGLTTASALMQFNPQFVMLVGMHLPIAALAAVAVTGVAMAAYAAFSTYRSFYPAQVAPEVTVEEVKAVESTTDATPVVPNPMHAKLLTAGLATAGLSMAGFSAMIQFGPKFALLAGVHLNPAALIAIAAFGALLLSISLYREVSAYIKARAEAPAADVVENSDTNAVSDVEPQPTYVQRVSNFFSAFTFAGKPVVEQNVEQTETETETVTVTNNL